MLTLHFCLDGSPSTVRYWNSVPRIGDTVSLPELGGNLNLLRVYDVIWEGAMEPTVCVYVHNVGAGANVGAGFIQVSRDGKTAYFSIGSKVDVLDLSTEIAGVIAPSP